MPDSVAANAVPQYPATRSGSATRPADEYNEKHKETSTSASLLSNSSVQGGLAPVTGNANHNPSEAQSTLVNTANPSPPPGHIAKTHNDEKHGLSIEENGFPDTNASPVKGGENATTNAENVSTADGDDDVVYPGGLALGLLTFGLCMATFTVALDNTSRSIFVSTRCVFGGSRELGSCLKSHYLQSQRAIATPEADLSAPTKVSAQVQC